MKIVFSIIFCAVFIPAVAQVDANRFTNIVQSVSSGSAAYGSGFKGRFETNGRVIGDQYLDSVFANSKLKLFKANERIDCPLRYDLINDELEIKTTAGIKVIKNSIVEYFVSLGRDNDSLLFVNSSNYKYTEDMAPLVGFYQVMNSGNFELLKYSRIEITKPSYNASLEVGDRNAYLVKKVSFYGAFKMQVFKFKSKKDLMKFIDEPNRLKVESFVKENKTDFKKESDLLDLFHFLNQL